MSTARKGAGGASIRLKHPAWSSARTGRPSYSVASGETRRGRGFGDTWRKRVAARRVTLGIQEAMR